MAKSSARQAYDKLLGGVAKKPADKLVKLTIRVPEDTHERLRRLAFEKKVSINRIILDLIDGLPL
jgi:predicted HicB family RNase H-like nuclease